MSISTNDPTIREYYGPEADFIGLILSSKYLKKGESLDGLWRRVAFGVAMAGEASPQEALEWGNRFYEDLLKNWRFVPGGRILYSVGRPNVAPVNCFVVPIYEDSIDGIFDFVNRQVKTYIYQGGVGVDVSILRPSGSPLRSRDGDSPGIIPFMRIFSQVTHSISQNGRRGALMITIRDWHPDLLAFIDAKDDPIGELLAKLEKVSPELADEYRWKVDMYRDISGANISVILSDEFMRAVEEDGEWPLIFPDYVRYSKEYDSEWDGDIRKWLAKYGWESVKVYKVVRAKEIWQKLVENAWRGAEPGVIFEKPIREDWAVPQPFLTTNPCSEIPLSAGEPCVLGHIVLDRFIKKYPYGFRYEDRLFGLKDYVVHTDIRDLDAVLKEIDWDSLRKIVHLAVRFLDNVVSLAIQTVPLEEQRIALKKYRRIGMGVTGLAEMFLLLGIPYDSELAVAVADRVMDFIARNAIEASVKLGEERGFADTLNNPNGFWGRHGKLGTHPRRNAHLMTVAPVGTGGIITGTMGGIEPIYQPYYIRKTRITGTGTVVVPLILQYLAGRPFETKEEVKAFLRYELPKEVQRWAYNINPFFRVKMQATIQRHVDNAISSTVNLPKDTPLEIVERVFSLAYALGCKGITVYREGSRGDILERDDDDESEELLHSIDKSETQVAYFKNELDAVRMVQVLKEGGKTGSSLLTATAKSGEICPVCETDEFLIRTNGCMTCQNCGWGKCST